MTNKLKLYWEFCRPFTLIPPAVGMISGGLTGLGAITPDAGRLVSSWGDGPGMIAARIVAGGLMAMFLNGFSNTLNQITDIKLDLINKPDRPLCDGRMQRNEAWVLTLVLLAVALGLALFVGWQCLMIVAITSVFTWSYSAKPLWMKSRGIWANLTIAIPRGVLLKVCGWSAVKGIFTAEPWIIGSVFGLFLLGASTTKDYADIQGDSAGGCRTLPVIYGVRTSAYMISPFFVLPFIWLIVGTQLGLFTGDPLILTCLGALLALWGVWVVAGILKDPEALAGKENHPSWTHMYLMMLTLQFGFALAYLVHI
ncbi:MAG: UbiA family prenyltransferase [Candidatus Alcyoniella australis]|nr:UbiA family prenyltransferase [Candidatus Alcyoniella australis]